MTELIINKPIDGIAGFGNPVQTTRVLLYSDIDQLPAERFAKINKFWVLHDELGSSFDDIDKIHFTRLLLSLDDKAKAVKVIENMRVLVHNIINETDPGSMAFACLVHSIDGEEIKDLSDENLKRVVKCLSDRGLTIDTLKKKSKSIRANIYSELETFFPDQFTSVMSTAFFSKMKQQTLKLLACIVRGEETEGIEGETNKYFASLISPKKLTGKYTDEIRYEHSFETNCIALTKFTNQPVKTLTTKEYFTLIEHYNAIMKKR